MWFLPTSLELAKSLRITRFCIFFSYLVIFATFCSVHIWSYYSSCNIYLILRRAVHRIQSQKTSLKYDTVKYSLILLSLNLSLFITYYSINLYIFIYFDNLADASLSLLTGTFLCGYALSVCQYIFTLCLSFSFALFKLCFYMILNFW